MPAAPALYVTQRDAVVENVAARVPTDERPATRNRKRRSAGDDDDPVVPRRKAVKRLRSERW